ncbi:hypothetical protein [Streptomyces reticuli]|uniref:hypothetical protein n=1 Tax=Streptomyces reticuli TaxID=1926 RepID=UPI00099EF2F0
MIGSAFFTAAPPHRRTAASPHRRTAAPTPAAPAPRSPRRFRSRRTRSRPQLPAAAAAPAPALAPPARLPRAFEALLGLPENLLRPVPDTANRSLILTETEMLRNLDVEFRGNGFRGELYSRLVRGGPDRRARRPRVR